MVTHNESLADGKAADADVGRVLVEPVVPRRSWGTFMVGVFAALAEFDWLLL